MSDDSVQIVHEASALELVVFGTLAFAALVFLVAAGLLVGLVALAVDRGRERRERRRVQRLVLR